MPVGARRVRMRGRLGIGTERVDGRQRRHVRHGSPNSLRKSALTHMLFVAEPNLFGAAVTRSRREYTKKGAHGGNMVSPVKRLRGLRPRRMRVRPGGFEPPTSRSGGARSIP